jgi:dihydrolipoamide dehydrogenase
MADQFDLVVLGGGTGGYSAALRAAELGMTVALVERSKVGGTCLHQGCIPTKALLHAAETYDVARDGERFGIKTADVTYDWGGVQAYKGGVVDRMYKGLQGLLKHRKVEVIEASGQLRSPTTIAAGSRELTAKKIVVATGSPVSIPASGSSPPTKRSCSIGFRAARSCSAPVR